MVPPEIQDITDTLTLPSSAAIGIPLALIAAVILAIGTQLQHGGVAKVEASLEGGKTGLNLKQLSALLARPSWVIGTVLLGLAIVLQLTSLTMAPITVVQPLGAVALVVTAILNARITKTPLDARSIRSIVVCIVGVGAFVTTAAMVTQSHPVTATQLWIVLVVLAAVLAVLVTIFLLMRGRTPRPIFYIIAGGTLFGFVVTLAKVIIDRVRTLLSGGAQIDASDILTLVCLVGIAAAGLLGTYFVQTAHSTNPPDLVVAGLTVIDPIVAVSLGIVVLGEAAGAPFIAVVAFGVFAAVAVWGVVSLSRHHPQALSNASLADVVDRDRDER